jgi:multisubunit Na+/H+ antiporter MnhF subunit
MNMNNVQSVSLKRRLQLVLLLMIVWEALSLLAEISFGGPLFKISGDQVGGILAARGGFGGVNIVPMVLYIYAFARGPLRYRGVLWLGALQHAAAALLCVFHVARDNIGFGDVIVTFAVSVAFVVLLLVNMPRGQVT